MYQDLMAESEIPPTPAELYARASSDVSVLEEIRLARTRLGWRLWPATTRQS